MVREYGEMLCLQLATGVTDLNKTFFWAGIIVLGSVLLCLCPVLQTSPQA